MPQVFLGRLFSILKVRVNGPQRLGFQIRIAAIKHKDRVERGSIKRGRNTAPQLHRPRGGIIGEAYVRRQWDLDQYRRMLKHTLNARTEPIIAPIMEKEWIGRVGVKSLLGLFRRYRPRLTDMAGQTGASIAAEGLTLEQVLAAVAVPSVFAPSSSCAASACSWACASDDVSADATAKMAHEKITINIFTMCFSTTMLFSARIAVQRHPLLPLEPDPFAAEVRAQHGLLLIRVLVVFTNLLDLLATLPPHFRGVEENHEEGSPPRWRRWRR